MDDRIRFEPASTAVPGCPLCQEAGGTLLWEDARWRVVRVVDADFPAYYRVVSNEHVRELSELDPADRHRCMALVCAVERVLIQTLRPDKINLAAFGNMVPHLHWHVIARFDWDSHFPHPVWGPRQRDVVPAAVERMGMALGALDTAVVQALARA